MPEFHVMSPSDLAPRSSNNRDQCSLVHSNPYRILEGRTKEWSRRYRRQVPRAPAVLPQFVWNVPKWNAFAPNEVRTAHISHGCQRTSSTLSSRAGVLRSPIPLHLHSSWDILVVSEIEGLQKLTDRVIIIIANETSLYIPEPAICSDSTSSCASSSWAIYLSIEVFVGFKFMRLQISLHRCWSANNLIPAGPWSPKPDFLSILRTWK